MKSTSGRFYSFRLYGKYSVSVLWFFFFKGRDDLESFQLEISGFLKEMACPYSVLVSGDIKDRLKKKDDCLKLLCKLSFFEHLNSYVCGFCYFQDLWNFISEALEILYVEKVLTFDLRSEADLEIPI